MKQRISMLVLALVTTHATADDHLVCSRVASQAEGHWPVREESFNQSNADDAISSMASVLESPDTTADFVRFENGLMIIKRYLLKCYAMTDPFYQQLFCYFLKSEAYVRH